VTINSTPRSSAGRCRGRAADRAGDEDVDHRRGRDGNRRARIARQGGRDLEGTPAHSLRDRAVHLGAGRRDAGAPVAARGKLPLSAPISG
jgi:hypothetical protein